MQASHDSNGQTVANSVTGGTAGGSKLHGGDLTGSGHEPIVSPVTGGAAVGALGGVSSTTSVMGAPGAASYGQLGTTTQMLSGGDNFSGYQNMFTPDYLSFGMYGYYGNSQGLGDASAAAASANPNSLWSGTATGAASTGQSDMSLSYLNFQPPGGAHSYSDYGYYSFNAQNPYSTWGTPATAASASGLDYNDLSAAANAAAWGPTIGAPPGNSATATGQHDYTAGTTNGSALLKETANSLHQQHQQLGGSSSLFAASAGSSVGYGSSQQQGAQQQANNSNIFVNGGLTNSANSAILAPMAHSAVSTGDFTTTSATHPHSSGVVPVSSGMLGGGVDRSGVTGAGVPGNDMCGLEQTFSQFGLGHSPSGHGALTSGTAANLSGLMASPPGGHHVGQPTQVQQQQQQQPPPPHGQSVGGAMPVSSIRSDETHFPGLGAASTSVGVSVAVSSQASAVPSSISVMGGGGVPSSGGGGGGGKKTWASIASQPAKGSAATLGVIPGPGGRKLPGVGSSGGLGPLGGGGSSKAPGRGTPTVLRPNMPWDSTGGPSSGGHGNSKSGSSSRGGRSGGGHGGGGGGGGSSVSSGGPVQSLNSGGGGSSGTTPGVLFTNEELASKNFNPRTFDLSPKTAKFFVIKSYSEDDIHRSIKYQIWCSTEHGNKKLDSAFHEMENRGPVYLFFSVNGSGHFCGVAQMASRVDYDTRAGVWCQDKWKGEFRVKWIYVKDVPNSQLRHIRLETNENKPVTNSRDATEVPLEKGRLVLKVIHTYKHTTSIFDDFSHYERREEQENQKRNNGGPAIGAGSNTFSH